MELANKKDLEKTNEKVNKHYKYNKKVHRKLHKRVKTLERREGMIYDKLHMLDKLEGLNLNKDDLIKEIIEVQDTQKKRKIKYPGLVRFIWKFQTTHTIPKKKKGRQSGMLRPFFFF